MHRLIRLVSIIAILLPLAPPWARAAWPVNGAEVCVAQNNQEYPQIVADGSGGAIIAWLDDRSPGAAAIYAQRIDGAGSVLWASDGVLVNTPSEYINLSIMRLVPDGAGGAIIAWIEDAGGVYSVRAQRMNGSGEPQWWAGGSPIGNAGGLGDYLEMAPDGTGGAVVAWQLAGGNMSDVRAQRIAPQGYVMWDANGVVMGVANHDQTEPAVTGDGAGGAIVSWSELTGTCYNIRLQRIRMNGAIAWTAGGISACSVDSPQSRSRIAWDGIGGAIVAWVDTRSPATDSDIYAQRIDSSGAALWTPAGFAVCVAAGSQDSPQLACAPSGGAYMAWMDNRVTYGDVYAQRLRADGSAAWNTEGVAVCSEATAEYDAQIAVGADGRALVVWQDTRSDYGDIYVQKYDTAGVAAKPANGEAICAAASGQARPRLIPNSPGGAFVTWIDGRDGVQLDIYALAFTEPATGTEPPKVEHATRLAQNFPNPFNPTTRIAFGLSAPANVSLRIYDAGGRLVRELVNEKRPAGRFEEIWDGKGARGEASASGIYFYRLTAGSFAETRKMILLR